MSADELLDELDARLSGAEVSLVGLAAADDSPGLGRRKHLQSKSQGVALALSYLRELRRDLAAEQS